MNRERIFYVGLILVLFISSFLCKGKKVVQVDKPIIKIDTVTNTMVSIDTFYRTVTDEIEVPVLDTRYVYVHDTITGEIDTLTEVSSYYKDSILTLDIVNVIKGDYYGNRIKYSVTNNTIVRDSIIERIINRTETKEVMKYNNGLYFGLGVSYPIAPNIGLLYVGKKNWAVGITKDLGFKEGNFNNNTYLTIYKKF
jgi:hypothetical protein